MYKRQGGALPIDAVATAILDLSFLAPAAGFTALAALTSWILDRAWNSHQNHRGTSILTLAYAALPMASFALRYLAHPMEIASVPTAELAAATGLGILSSILVWLLIYLLGYRRDTLEGDHS